MAVTAMDCTRAWANATAQRVPEIASIAHARTPVGSAVAYNGA